MATAVKDKQEEMSKWLQAVEQTGHRLQGHNEAGDRDDLSEYSGLGDAPYNALDVSDNYSMYTESAYHSNTRG